MIGGLTWSALIGAATVDSINPCTLAILIILLTTLLTNNKKDKILGAGIFFALAIYISYFLMGLGIYSAISLAESYLRIFYYLIIVLAFLIGVFSIKSYFKYKPGFFSVEIPFSWRPFMKQIISKTVSIPGAFFIGFLCSLFLVPCSSGPYLVILGLLANTATKSTAIFLLLIYNAIFILPMILITILVYIGKAKIEEVSRFREKYIRLIHLISGIIMVCLSLILLYALYAHLI